MTSRAEVLQAARQLYIRGPLITRTLQKLRPYICPFEILIDLVPAGSRVLDVGCGSGLFLGLLAYFDRLSSGYGFDVSSVAIETAKKMTHQLPQSARIRFQTRAANQPWPSGEFDVITMIDVMHHVEPAQQEAIFEKAASRLGNGGLFIYKDMAEHPAWKAWANRLHDLILARQRIHYLPIATASRLAREQNFQVAQATTSSRLWYAHELLVLRKSSAPHSGRLQ